MPARSVIEGFKQFHRRLTPSATESADARDHRASIEACLKTNFGLRRFFRSGSFGNGTSIRNHSDVDYFASLPAENMKNSSSATLNDVASALRRKFASTPGIRADSPAVIVPFGTDASETTEVIPAARVDSSGPFVYRIADGSGGWIRSSPEAQSGYVRSADSAAGDKAKPLIRFLKAWKYYRNVPISSFYLELVAAKHAAGAAPIIYSWDLRDVFAKLQNSGLAAAEDPAGKSGKVSACRTAAQRTDALSKVQSAAQRSRWAKERDDADDISGAFSWWDLLYDGMFPARYY